MLAIIAGCLAPGIILAYTDAKYRMLYDVLTIPILLLGLIYCVFNKNLAAGLIGFGFAFAVMFTGALMGGIAGGDVKLASGFGMWFGYPGIVYIIVISCLTGFLWGLFKLHKSGTLKKRMSVFSRGLFLRIFYSTKGVMNLPKLPEEGIAEDSIPYGTFMIITSWLIFFAKEVLPNVL